MIGKAPLDGLTLWKVAAILIAGVLGALGVFADFRDKQTKRVTVWGWVVGSLIAVSTLGGATAQFYQSERDAASALDAATTSLKTAAISLQTSQDMQRLLMPLRGATYSVSFHIDCKSIRFRGMCTKVLSTVRYPVAPIPSQEIWRHWPGGPKGFRLDCIIDFFPDPQAANSYATGGNKSQRFTPAEMMRINAKDYEDQKVVRLDYMETAPNAFPPEGFLLTIAVKGHMSGDLRELTGLSDLYGHGVVVENGLDTHELDGLAPVMLSITSRSGYCLQALGFTGFNHEPTDGDRASSELLNLPVPTSSPFFVGVLPSTPYFAE